MTETSEQSKAVIQIIDDSLAIYAERSIISADELSDTLLDIRSLMTRQDDNKE